MTPRRFVLLAESYGGAIGRWPENERDEAAALLRARPELGATLAAAAALDDALARWRVPGPGSALAARVVAAALADRRRRRQLLLWWSSLGAALTMAGGLAAGAGAVALLPPGAFGPADQRPGALEVLGSPVTAAPAGPTAAANAPDDAPP